MSDSVRQINVRLPANFYERVQRAAEADYRTVPQWTAKLIRREIERLETAADASS